MKKKRYLLVLAAALCLAGCGKENGSTDQNTDGGGQETYTLKIGNTVSDIDPFNVAYFRNVSLLCIWNSVFNVYR